MPSRSSSFFKLALLVSCFALLSLPLLSQSFYGSIVGTVNDSSNAAIAGATAALVNNGTGERRTAETDTAGTYRFVNLVPGNYKVEIEKPGFKRYTRDQIVVAVESAVRVDVDMQVGDVSQAVEVTSAAPLIQTETANLSQVVQGRAILETPLNGRNVLNLVGLVPGVVPQGSSDGSLTGKNVFAAGNYQIGGGAANQSATYLDGVPVNDTYGNIVALVPSQDTVSEFRVQTNNNSAEYGRYTGGVINMASRSGSNDFHGALYEYLRNRSLNANTFFANKTGAGKPAFTQNQFGGTVGGPIKKDKLFFFGGYEGFRQRQGNLFLNTVPTAAMTKGDFSDLRNAAGAVVPVYDPLTNCGQLSNPACVAGQTVQRQQFPNNIIPANRIDPAARKFLDFPIYALPNIPGTAFTRTFNYSRNATTGGDNDQWNFRGDYNMSDKQRILARYTRWKSSNLPVDVYGNGQRNGDPFSPEAFTTDQAVLADTYSISATTILDVRLGFMRWFYQRTPGNLGIDISKTFSLPSYFNQLPALDGVTPVTTVPSIAASGYNTIGTGLLFARDNSYSITPTLTKLFGKHTLKFGAELRRQDINYYQNNTTGGVFNFDNVFTAASSSGGGSGNAIASLLLGYSTNASTVQTSPFTAGGMRYQGYFVNDSYQASQKLTLNIGLRWEIPGVYTERFDRLVNFNADMVNPALNGVTLNGQPVKGAFVLVNTKDHPERGLRPEHFNLFAPRFGVAYRLTDKTVVRTGAGIFFVPANVQFPEGPYGNVVNYVNNVMVATSNGNITPANTLSNPFPNGFIAPPGRDPSFQKLLLGGNNRAPFEYTPYGYTVQWNFTVQHQFGQGIAVEGAYAAMKGTHLPQGGFQLNSLPESAMSLGSQLQTQVTNPFFGLIPNGVLSQPTVARGQLLLPFPQYTALPDPGAYRGNNTYHSLQAKAEKRFAAGGTLLASYTFSKIISDTETLTTWLDSANGVAGVQNWNNFRAEKSLTSFDSRQRLVITYGLDLPFGKGKKLLSNMNGVGDRIISGWGISGDSLFQEGFPLGMTATPNVTGFNTGLRPNVVPGCDPMKTGPVQQRLDNYFNTACFAVPAAYTYGNASRTDPRLRGPGLANYDLSLVKKTKINERFGLDFRTEFFNLFNRVQFGKPNQVASTASTSTFGIISTQQNNPRLIQFSLRLSF